MESNIQSNVKKTKAAKSSSCASIRVGKELRKRIIQELTSANKKDFGKKITASDYFQIAIDRITEADIKHLQENSLSNTDRLARDYQEWVKQHGPLSRDEYLGMRLRGEGGEHGKP